MRAEPLPPSSAQNMGGPNEDGGKASPRVPLANGSSTGSTSSGPQMLRQRVVPVDSSVLTLLESLRRDIDTSFKRYENEVQRVLQAQSCDTSGSHAAAGIAVAQGGDTSRNCATDIAVVHYDEAGRARAQVASTNTREEVPEDTQNAREPIPIGMRRGYTKRHQNILAAAIEEQARTNSGGIDEGERSSSSIQRIRGSRPKEDSMPIDTVVRDIAARDPDDGFIVKASRLKFNAKPLVPENSKMHKRVNGPSYKNVRMLFLILDAILLVFELQLMSKSMSKDRNDMEEPVFRFISLFLCLYIWGDLILAFVLEFPRFDILVGRTGYRFLNIIALVQHTMDLAGAFALPNRRFTSWFRIVVSRVSFIRVLRTTVVLPGLASMGVRQKLGELHIMIRALTGTVQPLLWCVLMYFIILLIFGAFFTEASSSHIARVIPLDMTPEEDEKLLINDWGDLGKAIYSLFVAMLGGKDWGDLYDSLDVLSFPSKAGFIGYICFTYIALLNTVTAVFIKCAFLRFEHDREFVIQQELDEKREYLLDVKGIFCELDEDNSGTINAKELLEQIKNPDVAAYFSKLGVDTDEVDKLFELMDEDGSGFITQEEFLWGCLRLKGWAKSLDLEILQRDVNFAIQKITEIHRGLKDNLAVGRMQKVQEQLADMDRNIQDRFARWMDLFFDPGSHGFETRSMDFSGVEPSSRTVPISGSKVTEATRRRFF